MEALLADTIEELDVEDNAEAIKLIRAAAKPLKQQNGRLARLVVHLFVGLALHTTVKSAPWLTAFEDEIEAIEEQLLARTAAARAETQSATRAHADALARKLAAEPAFSHGRTSIAKRMLLAREMFPSEDDALLRDIVTTAEGLQWLAQSGFKR